MRHAAANSEDLINLDLDFNDWHFSCEHIFESKIIPSEEC